MRIDHPDIESRFSLCDNTTRNVLHDKFGIGAKQINENGCNITQQLICAQHLMNFACSEGKDTIFDRCALDGAVYTTYLYRQGKASQKTSLIADTLFQNLSYDINLYIVPEIPIKDDGERSLNIEFYNDIVTLFDEYLQLRSSKVIRISGTVEQRVEQVIQIINSYDEYFKKE